MRYRLEKKQGSLIDEKLCHALQQQLSVSSFVAEILCSRGIDRVKDAQMFLNPRQEDLLDPMLFSDMEDSVSMIKGMIAQNKKICIYGDYDADGVCASTILFKVLKKMNADVSCFLPDRTDHGYGLSKKALDSIQAMNLLITVDCGITNVDEIEYAKQLGMKTIVTDHHECSPILPKADFILDAKRKEETYPYKDLCGAGVAFKLACALLGEEAFEFIDIAAFATIADIVPLLGENRVIAALGLKKMNENPNEGIAELYRNAIQKRNEIDSQTVAFALAPRLNAAGRLASANSAFELLTTEDQNRREQLAKELCDLNTIRQQRQEHITKEALEKPYDESEWLALFYDESWDVGIVGLAASKVSETLHRPSVLLGKSGEYYTGSARSIDGVDIHDALSSQADLFEKFGGHKSAAGLTIRKENIKILKSRLELYLHEKYSEDLFKPSKQYDIEADVSDISNELIEEMNMLRPCGHANPPVEMLIRNAHIIEAKPIGEGRHVRFRLSKAGQGKLNAVVFRKSMDEMPKRADVVGIVSMNDFDKKPQMIVSTFSFDESEAMIYSKHERILREIKIPTKQEKERYKYGREELLQLYFELKDFLSEHSNFETMDQFLHAFIKCSKEKDLAKIAFAFAVLQDIGLLEVKNSGKIHIMLRHKKTELENSSLYRKFRKEDSDGY